MKNVLIHVNGIKCTFEYISLFYLSEVREATCQSTSSSSCMRDMW